MNNIIEKNVTIKGMIKNIKYSKNNYFIFHITNEDNILKKYKYKYNNPYFLCKGNSFFSLKEGDQIEVVGNIVDNRNKSDIEYYLLECIEINKNFIQTEEGFLNYLNSLKGIGKKTAEKIVSLYKNDITNSFNNFTNDIINENLLIKNLLKNKINIVKEQLIIQNKKNENDVILSNSELSFIKEMKLTQGLVNKIKKHNKNNNIISIFEKNPYELALSIKGIGFKTIDKQALIIKEKLKTEDLDFEIGRISAAIYYSLKKAEENGHSYLRKLGLIHYINTELNITNLDETIFIKSLELLINKEYIIKEDFNILTKEEVKEEQIRYYLKYNHNNELIIAKIINERLKIKDNKVNIEKFEFGNFEPSELQKKAIEFSLCKNTLILTGGPGTGKTSIAKYMYVNLKKYLPKLNISLMAPTGTAAKRISQVIGAPATTIHRGLKLKFSTFVEENDLHSFESDIVIIDEVSMLTDDLMRTVLQRIRINTKLILIGDVDQLEAVGVGSVLNNLIKSNVPTIKLDKVFRQALENPNVSFAYDINKGIYDTYTKYKTYECDYNKQLNILIKKSYNKNVNEFYSEIMESDIVNESLKLYQRNELLDVQVLIPIKNGGKGSGNSINNKLQKLLNENEFISHSIKKVNFKIGDKVIQKRNNYIKNIFNGNLGIIKSFDIDTGLVTISFIDGTGMIDIDFSILSKEKDSSLEENIELAYCITIHKSQGQEYKEIILALNNFFFINRKLFFTGLTRTRDKAIIITNDTNIVHAIKTETGKESINGKLVPIKRNTTLFERITTFNNLDTSSHK